MLETDIDPRNKSLYDCRDFRVPMDTDELPHQMIVSTEQGELYLFDNLEFRSVLSSSPSDGDAICSLAAFSKGFVAGGANGVLRVYEKSEDPREFFKCLKVRNAVRAMTNKIVFHGRSPLLRYGYG